MNDNSTFEVTKLNGNNFALWEFGIKFALEAKELTGYIDGTEEEPDKEAKPADWKAWRTKRSQAAVILLGSIDVSLHPLLINCQTPKEIWDKIKGVYSSSRENSKDDAYEKFYSFRFDGGTSMNLQLEKFGSILKQLKDAGETHSDSSICNRLLTCLPARFSSFRMT